MKVENFHSKIYFWYDQRSTEVWVTNLVLFLRQSMKFHFLTQFSTDFGQQGLSNDRQCSTYYIILWRKNYDFFMKIQKFWAKKSFRVLDFQKNTSLKRTFFGELRNKVPFFQWFSNFTFIFYYQRAVKTLDFQK